MISTPAMLALLVAFAALVGGVVGTVFVAKQTPRREWLVALCVLCATLGGLVLIVFAVSALIPPLT